MAVAATKPAPQPNETIALYNGAAMLQFYEKLGRKKHVYLLDGREIVSVTKVLDVLAKPALINWALNEMERALLSSWKPGQQYDEVEIPALVAAAKRAKDEISSEAKTVSSVVHDWVKDYISMKLGALGNVSEIMPDSPFNEAARAGCESFLAWERSHTIEWISSERKVASRMYGFAGTLDFEARIDGQLVLGDIKTSKGIWPEYWLQTAAYQLASDEEAGIWDDSPTTNSAYDKRVIVRLGKDPDVYGGVEFEVQQSTQFARDAQLFLAALTLQQGMAVLNKFKGETDE